MMIARMYEVHVLVHVCTCSFNECTCRFTIIIVLEKLPFSSYSHL